MIISIAISYMLNASLILFIGVVSDEHGGCHRAALAGRFVGAALWPITLPVVIAAALWDRGHPVQRALLPSFLAQRAKRPVDDVSIPRMIGKLK